MQIHYVGAIWRMLAYIFIETCGGIFVYGRNLYFSKCIKLIIMPRSHETRHQFSFVYSGNYR